MATSPIRKEIRAYSKEYDSLMRKIVSEITEKLRGYRGDPRKIVDAVFAKYGIDEKLKKTMLGGIANSMIAAAGLDKSRGIVLERWWLSKAYSADGKKFSTRVNEASRRAEIVDVVRSAMAKEQSWRKAAQSLSDAGLQKADVAKKITALEGHARKSYAMTNDAVGYAEYKRVLRNAQRAVDKLVDPSTSKLRRAYQDVIDATEKASGAAMDNAIKYAAYFKERYNAERIARTEMATAYGQAFFTEGLSDEDVIGWKADLSDAHNIPDICDFHTSADLYGMGAGTYPIGRGPAFPFHPNCTCALSYLYSGEADVSNKMDAKQGEKYLESLPKEKAVELLGVQGYKDFKRDPSSWRENLTNWNGHEIKEATVPLTVLHGEQ